MKKRQEGDKMSGVREGAQVANKSDGRIGAREGMATTVFTVYHIQTSIFCYIFLTVLCFP